MKNRDFVIDISEAAESDAGEILDVQKQAFHGQGALYGDYTLPPLVQEQTELVQDFKKHVFLKAMLYGKIIGSVRGCTEKETCRISRLCVHPDHQNKGIGKMLMRAIERKFSNAWRYELFTGYKSVKNLALYQKLGYRKYAEKPQDNNITLICMEKRSALARETNMADQQIKSILKQTFDAVSNGYDGEALRFFPISAGNMAALIGLRGDEHVLDVACGTGHAALAVAALLPEGRVTAVDFSTGMLDQARKKAESLDIRNVEFIERDMQHLDFSGSPFDIAVCAFGIFFVEDMDTQLAHIASTVKPGGRIIISSFQENYFQPLRDLMAKRLEGLGVQMPPQIWKRISNEAGCRQLFEQAGLANISVNRKNVGYYLKSEDQWWNVIWNAGFRRMVGQLKPEDQERFKREHLEEIAALRTDKGIWLDVGVLYTMGTKR
jgi:ubiquinone/menaquinone biosynthesis C-methylase UbiE/GNAT superfamily N-acetyltransferase